jgi:site-specific recombinase XerD
VSKQGGNNIKVLGKGNKERIVYFGKRTSKALWKYIVPQLGASRQDDFLFIVGAAGKALSTG